MCGPSEPHTQLPPQENAELNTSLEFAQAWTRLPSKVFGSDFTWCSQETLSHLLHDTCYKPSWVHLRAFAPAALPA